jgi:D-threonine aldolase
MDADYGRNRDRDGEPTKAFEPSLFVWATVMGRPAEDRAIVDTGLRALAFDLGPPLVCDEPAATYERAPDERRKLAVPAATNRLGLGDKFRLIPGHCDPTVNLYDWYVCVRQPRRGGLADHRPRRGLLTFVAWPRRAFMMFVNLRPISAGQNGSQT